MSNVTPISHARKIRADQAGLAVALLSRRYRLQDETTVELAMKARRLVLCGRTAGAVRAKMLLEVRKLSACSPEAA